MKRREGVDKQPGGNDLPDASLSAAVMHSSRALVTGDSVRP
jgi:hypothetical protein